jgi:hypothetical protein
MAVTKTNGFPYQDSADGVRVRMAGLEVSRAEVGIVCVRRVSVWQVDR